MMNTNPFAKKRDVTLDEINRFMAARRKTLDALPEDERAWFVAFVADTFGDQVPVFRPATRLDETMSIDDVVLSVLPFARDGDPLHSAIRHHEGVAIEKTSWLNVHGTLADAEAWRAIWLGAVSGWPAEVRERLAPRLLTGAARWSAHAWFDAIELRIAWRDERGYPQVAAHLLDLVADHLLLFRALQTEEDRYDAEFDGAMEALPARPSVHAPDFEGSTPLAKALFAAGCARANVRGLSFLREGQRFWSGPRALAPRTRPLTTDEFRAYQDAQQPPLAPPAASLDDLVRELRELRVFLAEKGIEAPTSVTELQATNGDGK